MTTPAVDPATQLPLPSPEPIPAPDEPVTLPAAVLPPSTPPVTGPVIADNEAAALLEAVEDLGSRALHTFWQSAAATGVTLYAASGLDVHQLLTISGAEKGISVVVVGAVAAGFSSVKTLAVQYLTAKKALK